MALGVALNWIANAFVAVSFPLVHRTLGPYTFFVFALTTAGFAFHAWAYVPETKGRTIAQIIAAFDRL